jgi:hypothetical protein
MPAVLLTPTVANGLCATKGFALHREWEGAEMDLGLWWLLSLIMLHCDLLAEA